MSDNSSSGHSSEQSAHRLFSKRAFARRGAPLLLAAGVLGAATLAGCGGGGGNGNSNGGTTGTGTSGTGTTGTNTTGTVFNADISGKVTDTQGNGVPGVSIIPDSGGTVTLSLGQGGYRLNNLSGNTVHKITAAVTQNNTQYTGSTQIYAVGDFLTTNANILLSPIGRQATVSGTVRDVSGSPIPNVQVSLALPNGTTAVPGKYSSLVAFTNASGVYTITNIPIDLPSGLPIVIAASATGAQNQTATLPAVNQAAGIYNHDFTLTGVTGQSAAAPAIQSVTTATEPTDSQSGRLRAAAATAATPTSIYDRIRRQLSPAYARAANNRIATSKRLTARAVGNYAVETDVAFTPPASGSVSYYNFYQTTGSTAITTTPGAFDSFSDPLATYYTALTFSTSTGNATLAGTQYNFALTSVSTNNLESALSQTFSIIPLGPINFSQPTVGQVYTTTATLTWNAVTGATKYYVFVYSQYPTFAGNPTPVASTTTPLAAGTLTYTPSLLVGKDYYAVVVATADPNETPGQSNLHPVTNGVMSFSQITRFHLQ